MTNKPRSISCKPEFYNRVKAFADRAGVSMRAVIETLTHDALNAHGVPRVDYENPQAELVRRALQEDLGGLVVEAVPEPAPPPPRACSPSARPLCGPHLAATTTQEATAATTTTQEATAATTTTQEATAATTTTQEATAATTTTQEAANAPEPDHRAISF